MPYDNPVGMISTSSTIRWYLWRVGDRLHYTFYHAYGPDEGYFDLKCNSATIKIFIETYATNPDTGEQIHSFGKIYYGTNWDAEGVQNAIASEQGGTPGTAEVRYYEWIDKEEGCPIGTTSTTGTRGANKGSVGSEGTQGVMK